MTDYKEFRRLNIAKLEGDEDRDVLRDAIRDETGRRVDEMPYAELVRAFFRVFENKPANEWPAGWVKPADEDIRRVLLANPSVKSKDVAAVFDMPEYVVRGIKADLTKERGELLKIAGDEYQEYEAWACEDF